MKFRIEIVRIDDDETVEVLHRLSVDEIDPERARAKANSLLSTWRSKGASGVQIFDQREELYSWKRI